jgi:hypothetical protein
MAEERLSLTAADAVDAVARSAASVAASGAPTEAPIPTQPTGGPPMPAGGGSRRIPGSGPTARKTPLLRAAE